MSSSAAEAQKQNPNVSAASELVGYLWSGFTNLSGVTEAPVKDQRDSQPKQKICTDFLDFADMDRTSLISIALVVAIIYSLRQ